MENRFIFNLKKLSNFKRLSVTINKIKYEEYKIDRSRILFFLFCNFKKFADIYLL